MAKNILVIDDNKYHCEFITAAAELYSWPCTTTLNALAFFENLTQDTGVILLDLMMPEMDGVELLTLLAARQCGARIVLMSGVGGQVLEATDRLAQSLGLSIAGHLRKPFRLAEFEAIVAPLVRGSGARSSSAVVPTVFESGPQIGMEHAEVVAREQHRMEAAA